MASRRLVMLDRDGTLIVERHYLRDAREVELLPGAAYALQNLRNLGFGAVVITNQSAIGRGLLDESGLREIHQRMRELLADEGAKVDGIYHCPHTPEERCVCRKPQIGMIQQAAFELKFDPAASFMIGDKACDIHAGERAGATTILVRTGYGKEAERQQGVRPDYVVDDLLAASELIGGMVASGKPATQRRLRAA